MNKYSAENLLGEHVGDGTVMQIWTFEAQRAKIQ